MAIGAINALIDIAIGMLPKACDAIKVVAEIARWIVNEIARGEIIPPGITIDTWTRSRGRWFRYLSRSDDNRRRWLDRWL